MAAAKQWLARRWGAVLAAVAVVVAAEVAVATTLTVTAAVRQNVTLAVIVALLCIAKGIAVVAFVVRVVALVVVVLFIPLIVLLAVPFAVVLCKVVHQAVPIGILVFAVSQRPSAAAGSSRRASPSRISGSHNRSACVRPDISVAIYVASMPGAGRHCACRRVVCCGDATVAAAAAATSVMPTLQAAYGGLDDRVRLP
jgi:hypothetical protein